jgi:serine protease Do
MAASRYFAMLWLGLIGAAALAETTLEERERINNVSLSVYRMTAAYEEGGSATGSAIHIGDGKFITSCHLTRDAKGVRISRGSKFWPAYWQHKNVDRDLCLVMTREVPPHVAQLGESSTLRVGQRVFSVGYPAALTGLNIQYGTIRALYDFDGGKVIRTAAFFARGESGGALFDSDGKVVGVLTFKSRVGADQNFAVPVNWVREIEARAKDQPSADGAPTFWESDFAARPRFLDAAALEAGGEWDKLLAVAQEWASGAANDPEPLLAISKALFHLQREREAIDYARKALELSPEHAETWFQAAMIYRKLDDKPELDKAVAKVAQLSPDRVDDLDVGTASAQRADCGKENSSAAGC